MLKPKQKIIFAFLLVYALFGFISLNRHSQAKNFSYHTELWADKAGYNVYLPSLFIYDFNANAFPDSTDFKTGHGFILNSETGKIVTKYPYGVALLQSPFWLIAHFISNEKDGYSLLYQKSIDLAGSFYLTLGLFFLFFMFNKLYAAKQSVLLSLSVILSSGIFYYGIFETGMSHIYSFCCLSILMYLLLHKNDFKPSYYLLFISLIAMIYVIVRPINALFLLPLLMYFLYINHPDYFNRNNLLNMSKAQFLTILMIIFLFALPQVLYYKYAFGSFIAKSYQNESFQIPTPDRIIKLLFSPDNGLLIYYPICVLMVIYSFCIKHSYKLLILLLFISYILIYASWWSLSLGCGFGHRAINDIILLFFIPLFITPVKIKKWLIIFLICFSIVNIKFIFSYDSCLFTSYDWDFTEYRSILFGDFK